MRYKDILTEEEDRKIEDLKIDLLDAPNARVRELIVAEIDEIFENAKRRYYTKRSPLTTATGEESS